MTAVGQTIPGAFGTLTITSIAEGSVGYSYTLSGAIDHSDAVADSDSFAVVVTDVDGDSDSSTLTIDITNDGFYGNDDDDNSIEGYRRHARGPGRHGSQRRCSDNDTGTGEVRIRRKCGC